MTVNQYQIGYTKPGQIWFLYILNDISQHLINSQWFLVNKIDKNLFQETLLGYKASNYDIEPGFPNCSSLKDLKKLIKYMKLMSQDWIVEITEENAKVLNGYRKLMLDS